MGKEMDEDQVEEIEEVAKDPPSFRFFPSTRVAMMFLAFWGLTAINCGFASFNFAIVCMVNPQGDAEQSSSPSSHDVTPQNTTTATTGQFQWDKSAQANLVAAYAWGGILTSVPSGWLSDKYGGKYVFLACLLISAISTVLSPWAAYRGESWLFAARVFNGMAGGAGWPSVIQMATRWGAPSERATLIGLSTVGVQFGQLLTIGVAGELCSSALGWPSIFYIWAGFIALMALVWLIFYTDRPERARFIDPREAAYLSAAHDESSSSNPRPRPPWTRILLAPSALAIYLCHFSNIWMLTFTNEFVPSYGHEVLHLDLASNGVYSALPLLAQFVSCLLFGNLADKISFRSRTFSVKFFNTLCMWVPCAGILVLTLASQSVPGPGLPVFCLCFCTFFYSSSVAGFIRCMVLIAPKYSGTISSVSNVYSYVACISMPYVVGVVTHNGDAPGWNAAFYIGLAISVFGGLEFLIMGSGEEQKWAKDDGEEDRKGKMVMEGNMEVGREGVRLKF